MGKCSDGGECGLGGYCKDCIEASVIDDLEISKMGMCEANCGKMSKVYGSKYCPECHAKYSRASFALVFRPKTEKPRQIEDGRTVLLFNQCDGFHIAYARFNDDESFDGFYPFDGEEYGADFYEAWAILPDEIRDLHPIFSKAV